MTVSAAALSALMRSGKLGSLSIVELMSWLLKLDQARPLPLRL
jgi:hypothetical protein